MTNYDDGLVEFKDLGPNDYWCLSYRNPPVSIFKGSDLYSVYKSALVAVKRPELDADTLVVRLRKVLYKELKPGDLFFLPGHPNIASLRRVDSLWKGDGYVHKNLWSDVLIASIDKETVVYVMPDRSNASETSKEEDTQPATRFSFKEAESLLAVMHFLPGWVATEERVSLESLSSKILESFFPETQERIKVDASVRQEALVEKYGNLEEILTHHAWDDAKIKYSSLEPGDRFTFSRYENNIFRAVGTLGSTEPLSYVDSEWRLEDNVAGLVRRDVYLLDQVPDSVLAKHGFINQDNEHE